MDQKDEKVEKNNKEGVWSALSLAWQLGYTIAIPIVVLALGGRFLDRYFGTSPWLLLAGVFLSLGLSTVAVYYKTIKIIATTEKEIKESQKNKL
ncbi:hypothetical protein A2316_02895 [Candidatus Falkowbacteria bacterium RIFOXYB2_FULL_38_15]|uniref:ATP synthase subunit n=1 Tax=Candidatus Falkowbacteria bacterium RIFOXYA2_FULL_38_12 TaxID=1797993 RepID=A0A1F5S321_9BACT|nr:MAG: hypothetical protein A2257_01595 [Candidatus Falkowbacteria bacterium RIFOXYA2_FULL_38_12]OGF32454.1 MAG: hypothetical protein A2316_02895 [Candidatus Falkowbacteria bacterium RIFOXYB2_FULL_38_15]OGF42413.1 MAG: hypothetical protein A2555_00500 [Candidatus Falkowbacteria bacterium RIFOXYD2_FULL_39_16]